MAERGERLVNITGFYSPLKKKSARKTDSSGKAGGVDETNNDRGKCEEEELVERVENLELVNTLEQEDRGEKEEEDEDEDNEGWITPENLQQVCEEMGGVLDEVPQSLAVGCITTDFAMQAIY